MNLSQARSVLMLLLMLLLSVPTASAQEDDDDLSAYLQNYDVLLLYPEAIWSDFVLLRPASDFSGAIMTLTQQTGFSQTVTVDIAAIAEVTAPYTDFEHVWPIPLDNPPRLYELMTVRWDFIRTDGTIDSLAVSLRFEDTRALWLTDSTENVRLASPDRLNPSSIRADVERMYSLMQARSGQSGQIGLALYDSGLPADPCARDASGAPVVQAQGIVRSVTLPCDADKARTLHAASGYAIVQVDYLTYSSALEAVSRALVDRLYAPLWGEADVPAWFRYGLGVFYAPTDKSAYLDEARRATRTGGLVLTYDQVPTDPLKRATWQAQSYGMVLYMAEQIGVDGLFELAASLGTRSLEAAYQRAANAPLAGVFPAWRDWIFSQAARTAYTFTPYLDVTPTPTATLSPTPFPSTLTPTPTPTLTASVTPTVTGVLSPTPRPSDIPSATPTPTFTPRAVGSFTLTPETPAPQPAAPDVTVPLLIGAGGVALIAFVLGVRLVRRGRKKPEQKDDAV